MNYVVMATCAEFLLRCVPIVILELPPPLLPPPTIEDSIGPGACIEAIQCSTCKPSMELEIVFEWVMKVHSYSIIRIYVFMTVAAAFSDKGT